MKKLLALRLPTLFVLLLLLTGVGGTIFLTSSTTISRTNASVDDSPQDIRITNVTDTTITVSYTTPNSVLGTIHYGESDDLKAVALDDRDLGKGVPIPHTSHYFTLTDLRQDTEYHFSILSGTSTYLHSDKPFTVRTSRILTTTAPNLPQFSGSVLLPDDKLANDVILYLQSDTSQPVSTLVRPDTSYVLSLANLRTVNTASYDTLEPSSTLHLLFVSQFGNSTVTIRADQKNPLPPIVLSKNYDFTFSIPQTQLSRPAEGFPVTTSQKVKGAKTVLPTPKNPIVIDASQSAGVNVLGAQDTYMPPRKTSLKQVNFASLPNPNPISAQQNRSPLLLNGILGSIALIMGIFTISFIRRVSS